MEVLVTQNSPKNLEKEPSWGIHTSRFQNHKATEMMTVLWWLKERLSSQWKGTGTKKIVLDS
jgi:hypothetical protein